MRLGLLNGVTVTVALSALMLSSAGCSSISSCNRDEDHIDVGGFVNSDRTVYTSLRPARLEDADGGMLPSADQETLPAYTHFPANRIITFHVGLAGAPTAINPYLSFSPEGDATVAPCAGNQCLIRKRTKDEIVLRNDTCSEFWVWLTASTSATPFHEVPEGGATGGAPSVDPTDTAGAAGAL